jgi:hypothetical protein
VGLRGFGVGVVCVKLDGLDAAFRDLLPKTELKDKNKKQSNYAGVRWQG